MLPWTAEKMKDLLIGEKHRVFEFFSFMFHSFIFLFDKEKNRRNTLPIPTSFTDHSSITILYYLVFLR